MRLGEMRAPLHPETEHGRSSATVGKGDGNRLTTVGADGVQIAVASAPADEDSVGVTADFHLAAQGW